MTTPFEGVNAARAKINWDQVLEKASSIRGQPCTLDGREFFGGCNLVCCLVFEDGVRWAFRVSHDASPTAFESSVTTMRYIKSNVPDIPIAAVHAWSDSADGDGIGAPYMFLDWMEGRTLEWNNDFPPEPVRSKVLAQLARYTLDLINRTSKESGSQSALALMLRRIDGKLRRILKGDLAHFDFIDGLIYRAITEEKYHISVLDTLPFPMMHTDLSKSNIIVDDGFNITGILDWDDWATRVPMQCAVMCPIMIAAVNDSSDRPSFRKDRLTFIDHFTSSLATSGIRADIAARLPSILADEELQIFHASLSSKTVYADWVKKYCSRSDKWVKAASRALDKFVLAQKDLVDSPEIHTARLRLLQMQGEDF